jgi:hypothetical protein
MCRALVFGLCFLWSAQSYAFMGTELGPLLQLVSGQVRELERLAENVGVAKDQLKMLQDLNEGIDRTVNQIQSLQTIVERSQGMDPTSVQSLSDLNDLLERAQGTKGLVEDMIGVKIQLANQAISRSSTQSETAYLMGQEMVATGSQLASESQNASPGRAAQISAAAESAQMLSQGIQLQTLAQVAELQALLLEFQKSQLQKEAKDREVYRSQVVQQLSRKKKGRRA